MSCKRWPGSTNPLCGVLVTQEPDQGPPSRVGHTRRPASEQDNCRWWFVPRRKLKQGNMEKSDNVGGKVILGRWSQWQLSGHLNERRSESGQEAEEEAGTETRSRCCGSFGRVPCVPSHAVHTCLPSPLSVPVALCCQTDLRLLELLFLHTEHRRYWGFPSYLVPLPSHGWVQGCARQPLGPWQGVTYTVFRAPQRHGVTATLCGTLLDCARSSGLVPPWAWLLALE